MKLIKCLLLTAITLMTFVQCDDNTGTLGGSIIPEKDKITAETLSWPIVAIHISVNTPTRSREWYLTQVL